MTRVRFQLRSSGIKGESPEPLRSGVHTRGYLPHVKREGASYFVTFRLADSLPREVLLEFERERAEHLRQLKAKDSGLSETQIQREFRNKIERYLDRGVGACYLKQPEIAELVVQGLLYFEKKRYLLDEWIVMPNHVHVIVWPMPNDSLSAILKSWKTFTSRQANKLLRRTGQKFWQAESYDHWIRDDDEKARIRLYIYNNAKNAGLCQRPEEWRWSSAWLRSHP